MRRRHPRRRVNGFLLALEMVVLRPSLLRARSRGRIYFLGDNGETTVIEAGCEFNVLARNSLGEKVQASLAISQGQMFIRTERHLFCIGVR